jgi:hypothetical protein
MPRPSPEELADLLEQDRLWGRNIARTLADAEAQTLDIPPRKKRKDGDWVDIAALLDGYVVAYDLFDRDLWEWFAEAVPYMPLGEYPEPEHWEQFSIMELRLLLFAYYRKDRWDSQQVDTTYDIPANDILDVLREKLEKQS